MESRSESSIGRNRSRSDVGTDSAMPSPQGRARSAGPGTRPWVAEENIHKSSPELWRSRPVLWTLRALLWRSLWDQKFVEIDRSKRLRVAVQAP